MKRIIPFLDTVPAFSDMTLVSDELDVPYIIHEVQIHFPPGTENTNLIKVFVSGDPFTPSSGEPSGQNLFGYGGAVDYIVGDDVLIVLPVLFEVHERPTWIKVYAKNIDSYNHTVDVRVVVELLLKGD
ncbi:MAG TPA: hypothetical protein EYP19_00880 [Desulfobacterales bacterium]|nr:hypothetical protein [Desulfobacterales bacterium]